MLAAAGLVLQAAGGVPDEDRVPETLATLLDESFAECDKIILDEAIRIKARGGGGVEPWRENVPPAQMQKPIGRAGCCVLVMLIHNNIQYYAHVGDCRAVMTIDERASCGGNGSSSSSGGRRWASPKAKCAKTDRASGLKAGSAGDNEGSRLESAPSTPGQLPRIPMMLAFISATTTWTRGFPAHPAAPVAQVVAIINVSVTRVVTRSPLYTHTRAC